MSVSIFQFIPHSLSPLVAVFVFSVTLFLVCKYVYLYHYFQFSCHSVVSDSLRPHELQHARPPCPSPTPGVHSNLGPSSRWCHPAISSSVVPFSSTFNLSQHQGLFQRVSSLHQVVKGLESQAASSFCDDPHPVYGVCFSLNKSTSPVSLSLTEFFLWWDNQNPRTWASVSPDTR